jgi:hypothetical protein
MAALGDVVELTVNEKGEESIRLVAEAGSPEAEAFHEENGDPEHPVDLEPLINSDATLPPTSDSDTDLEKTRVTVWDGDKVVEIDTGRAKPKSDETQSAQETPETAGGDSSSSTGEVQKAFEPEDDVTPEVLVAAARTLDNSTALTRALHAQLTAARLHIGEVTEERDAAIEIAKKAMEGTRELLLKLGELPVGRKTGFSEVQKDFVDLEGIYDSEMRKSLAQSKKKG